MAEADFIQTSTFETRHFDALQESAEGWDQEYFKMVPGRFTGRLEMTQVGSRQVFRELWGQKIRYRGIAPQGTFGFALPLDQRGEGSWVGIPSCRDTIILQAPGLEADFVAPDYLDMLGFAVPEQEFQSIGAALSGNDGFNSCCHNTIHLNRANASRFRQDCLYLIDNAKLATSRSDQDYVLRLSEQIAKRLVVLVLNAKQPPASVSRPTNPASIVRQATELVMSDPNSRTGLTEICRHLGLSLRALHYAFQDVTGTSPATWLRRIRLNRAHKSLLQSSPEEVLIKRVALDNGFFHLGHFSAQYKALFGCLPSEKLRRS